MNGKVSSALNHSDREGAGEHPVCPRFSPVFRFSSVYFLLFSIWMSAHPRYDSQAWHTRYYERLAITAFDGLIWVGSIVWLFRMAGKAEKTAIHQNDAQG